MELMSTLAELTLGPLFEIKLEAIDPDTGAPVTGVVVTNVAIAVETDEPPPDPVETALETPLWIPLALEDQTAEAVA